MSAPEAQRSLMKMIAGSFYFCYIQTVRITIKNSKMLIKKKQKKTHNLDQKRFKSLCYVILVIENRLLSSLDQQVVSFGDSSIEMTN